MATVFPFSKIRSPNPNCGALWKRQLGFVIEALVTSPSLHTNTGAFCCVGFFDRPPREVWGRTLCALAKLALNATFATGPVDRRVGLAFLALGARQLLGNGFPVLCGASDHLEFAVVTSTNDGESEWSLAHLDVLLDTYSYDRERDAGNSRLPAVNADRGKLLSYGYPAAEFSPALSAG